MLYGRASEQASLERLVDGARAGASGVLVVRGEPGIGKSVLLEHAAGAAEGMRVLRGTGIESEADLPFAGLHMLLRPALHLLDRLPCPQEAALRGAFGLGPAAGERLLVGLSVLSLLSEFAGEDALLCVVDDAQWLDHASTEALLITARRLDAEGIALVLAARTPGLPAPDLPEQRDSRGPSSDAAWPFTALRTRVRSAVASDEPSPGRRSQIIPQPVEVPACVRSPETG
ncbi:ATP-binding protein [Microbispora sp. NPDC049125]|uniref:ATP-binding protein n=1 Tax=Microbispora sp. NPDC049125 TaxID=3154929 RepID=UPI0034653325